MRKSFNKKNFQKKPRKPIIKKSVESNEEYCPIDQIDLTHSYNDLFTKNASFAQHLEAQSTNPDKYLATLTTFNNYSIEVLQSAKVNLLAAAFARNDKRLIDYALTKGHLTFANILKTLTLLDSKREKRVLERRVLAAGKVSKIKPKSLKLRVDLKNLEKVSSAVTKGSLTGAVSRRIRRWVHNFTESELELFALSMPLESWRRLADLIHLNPTKDFPSKCGWFLPFCFGVTPPADSKVAKCQNLTTANVNEILIEFPDLPYSYVKTFKTGLNENSKELIARNAPDLDTILWHYEDLSCPQVNILEL